MRYLLILAISFVSLSYASEANGQTTSDIIGDGWEHIGTRKINKKIDKAEIPVLSSSSNA